MPTDWQVALPLHHTNCGFRESARAAGAQLPTTCMIRSPACTNKGQQRPRSPINSQKGLSTPPTLQVRREYRKGSTTSIPPFHHTSGRSSRHQLTPFLSLHTSFWRPLCGCGASLDGDLWLCNWLSNENIKYMHEPCFCLHSGVAARTDLSISSRC